MTGCDEEVGGLSVGDSTQATTVGIVYNQRKTRVLYRSQIDTARAVFLLNQK